MSVFCGSFALGDLRMAEKKIVADGTFERKDLCPSVTKKERQKACPSIG